MTGVRALAVAALAGIALALAGCGHPQQPSATTSATTSARLCSEKNLPCQRPGTEPRFYSGDELRYLEQLDSDHVPYSDAPQAVDTGHMVCQNQMQARGADAEAAAIVTAHWPDTLTNSQAESVVIAAWAYMGD
jgi:Protein of unknown function (DUF732)